MPGLKPGMWENKTGMANTLAFAHAPNQCHMVHDDTKEDAFPIAEGDNDSEAETMKFKQNVIITPIL